MTGRRRDPAHVSSRRALEHSSPKLLLRMPNWLGDCIMALPALRYLREALPEAYIAVACRESLADLLAAQPAVNEVFIAPKSGAGRLLRGLFSCRLASGGDKRFVPDLGVLFTNSFSTAVWMWKTGAKNRLGYNLDARGLFLTHPVRCDQRTLKIHFVDYYLELARKAAETVKSWRSRHIAVQDVLVDDDFRLPDLSIAPSGKAEASAILEKIAARDNYAVLAPASAYGPVKDWPPEYYRVLVERLVARYGMKVLVTGGAGQREVCRSIVGTARGAYNLAGETSLGSFLGLLAGGSLFVGGDSGGAHAAAALGLPTLVVFGVTNPTRTAPSGTQVYMLGGGVEEDIDLKTPEARAMAEEALRGITVDHVEEAIVELCGG